MLIAVSRSKKTSFCVCLFCFLFTFISYGLRDTALVMLKKIKNFKEVIKILSNKKLNVNFAKKLAEYIFSEIDQNSEKYTVYSQVPVNCIHRIDTEEDTPVFSNNLYSDTGILRIDTVLCVEDEIALCVLLKPSTKLKRLFKSTLRGLIAIEPPRSYCTENFAAYAIATLKRYMARRLNKSVKYKIVSCPVQSLSKIDFNGTEDSNERIKDELINSRTVDENLNITPYGRACGVMCKYSKSSCDTDKIDISFGTAEKSSEVFDTEKYFKMPESNGSNYVMPLKKRLMCLKMALPCDKTYGRLLAEKLNILLNTPLNEIMKGNTSMLNQLYYDINEAVDVVNASANKVHSADEISTYGELVDYLYYMKSLFYTGNYDDEDLNILFGNIIVDLGNFADCIRKKKISGRKYVRHTDSKELLSLNQRLFELNEGSNIIETIFLMPIGYYYYAASILIGSNYPNWLIRENVRKRLHFGSNCSEAFVMNSNLIDTILNERTYIYQNFDNNEATDQYVSLVYDLLVSPVVNVNNIKQNY